jgi:hypothetical protein
MSPMRRVRKANRHRVALHTLPRHRRMLECAGDYVYGAFSSNECPAGSARIATATGCRAAADAAGRGYSPAFQSQSTMPRGCYVTGLAVFLNVHATGDPDAAARLLCYTGTAVFTPAPTGEPLRSRLRSSPKCAGDPSAIPSLEGRLSRQLSAVGTHHHSTAKGCNSTRCCCARTLDALTCLCTGVPTELPTATGAHRFSFRSLFSAGVLKSVLNG